MAKVLVLYYSSWGHIEQMAYAAAEGAREAGAEVVVKRVPELVPTEIAQAAHYKTDQKAPIATVEELPEYDAIIIGTPTRYGTMTAQMKNFLDQTGGLWAQGKLIGKVGSVFTSTATQHGGQEATILTTLPVLLHHGMVVVGLPYSFQGQMGVDQITRRLALRRLDDRSRRRLAPAERDRPRRRPLPGQARGPDRGQARCEVSHRRGWL